ncbi:DNA methyltransferase [Curtobacterium sp. MCLR17_040]|uniref:DNA methyltransferase n=1 Tax=Curtobacterium sp. MCLR17_040 TaxID=2175625 RepID=UPI0015E8DE6D
MRTDQQIREAAARFIATLPHQQTPFSKRNWGTPLHSLCSYRGKLKPSIAHFLIREFTDRDQVVLDPFSGVGTIPLEARLQGRNAIASDLSPLAYIVSFAKVANLTQSAVDASMRRLSESLSDLVAPEIPDGFGLNGPVSSYFHEDTLTEIATARHHFLRLRSDDSLVGADAFVEANLLHILHGNRPYALSRRSHPLTPYSPSGPFEYKSVMQHLSKRIARLAPLSIELGNSTPEGRAIQTDFRRIDIDDSSVDCVITSPPFSDSFRFWSTNWLRLWFAGWEPEDFRSEPGAYLESEQKASFSVYSTFFSAMADKLRPGGLMILHLGAGPNQSMADAIVPYISEHFDSVYLGSESVQGGETLGLRDHGSTQAHNYLFLIRR